MRSNTKTLLILVSSLYATSAFAGLFGPSNYEECVLDKMKGRPLYLMSTVRSACLKEFPPELIIANDRVKYSWSDSSIDTELLNIEQLPPKVKLTRIDGIFYKGDCEGIQAETGVSGTAEKPLYGNTYKFKLVAGKRKCALFTFYGTE